MAIYPPVADNAGKVGDLLLIVQKDYGKNAWFQSVYQAYIRVIEQADNISRRNSDLIVHESGRTSVKIVLNRNPRDFSCGQQEELLEAISRLLNIGRVELDVIAVEPGSVVLTLGLPSERVHLFGVYFNRES